MPRFFSDEISDNTIIISGGDAVHIGRSLRMKPGDELIICSKGMEYRTSIRSISNSQVICDIISSSPSLAEPNIRLTLFQAIPKSDKLDFIVQKAVELGATEVCPVLTNRCVSRPDKKSFEKKKSRLQKIALEAAKQSGRGIIPTISDIITLDQCIQRMTAMGHAFICYEKGGKDLKDTAPVPGSSVGVLIGSEGGFASEEAEKCIASGITPIGLGPRILRCETAPLCAVSIIMSLTGNI